MTPAVRAPSPVRHLSRPRVELVEAERIGLTDHGRAVLRRAAACAESAPTARAHAPWRYQVDGDGLTFSVEAGGPLGRWDATAAGSALFHARASIAHQSMRSVLTRFPEGPGSPCFARLDPPVRRLGDDDFDPTDDLAVTAIDVTPLVRGFAPGGGTDAPMSRTLANYLSVASAADGVVVVQLVRRDHCEAVAGLIRRAGAVPGVADRVGVEGWHQVGGSGADSGRVRIPAARRGGGAPMASSSRGERSRRTMLLLGTASDSPRAWLRAGEALERVRLILAHYDYASTPLTRVVAVPETRAALRRGLGLTFQPQFLLLVGQGEVKEARPGDTCSED